MLIQFILKNFLSFREEAIFDMSAIHAYKEHEYNLIHTEKEKFLRVAAIYGANASGKSNFIYAYSCFRDIVIHSSNNVEVEEEKSIKARYCPFIFENQKENTEFQIIALIDGDEYKYGFEYNDKQIISEWLYKKDLHTNRTSIIFERGEELQFGASVRKECEIFGKQVSSETLVLSFFYQLQLHTDVFQKVFEEIRAPFILQSNYFENNDLITRFLPFFIENNKQELLAFLTAIDSGIKDIVYEGDGKETEFYTVHWNKKGEQFKLSLFDESEGTMKSISIYIVAKSVIKSNTVLMVDELNVKLHPLLLKFIIDLFYNDCSTAQLIYTTHDTTLLDKKFFRRDQIWFVQKDEFGHSQLYALSDFKVRSDASFEKDYLAGVYGGIPYLQDFELKR